MKLFKEESGWGIIKAVGGVIGGVAGAVMAAFKLVKAYHKYKDDTAEVVDEEQVEFCECPDEIIVEEYTPEDEITIEAEEIPEE